MKQIHIITHFEKKSTPSLLLSYAQGLYNKLTGNAKYPSPVNPTLAILLTLINALNAAITAWGDVHNHGTSQAHQNLLDAVKNMRNGINGLKHYCELTTPNDASGFLSAGWEVSEATDGKVGP